MKKHYAWWKYIKYIIQKYPERRDEDLTGVAKLEQKAVQDAIGATERVKDGKARLNLIRMVLWDGTHTIEGAALEIPCSRSLAAKWQRAFFEEVARSRALLD